MEAPESVHLEAAVIANHYFKLRRGGPTSRQVGALFMFRIKPSQDLVGLKVPLLQVTKSKVRDARRRCKRSQARPKQRRPNILPRKRKQNGILPSK